MYTDYIFGSIALLQGLVDRVNTMVYSMIIESDVYIDLKRMIAKLGCDKVYENKGKYRWNVPYTKAMITCIAGEIYKQYMCQKGATKKCLVLDCDNVLWGGVLSEDGIEGIRLGSDSGRSYRDFQIFVSSLYKCGVILTLCSKNDEKDVIRVFREHSGMVLREEQIACFKVNWRNKAENIIGISEELNIGLDSMVFVVSRVCTEHRRRGFEL